MSTRQATDDAPIESNRIGPGDPRYLAVTDRKSSVAVSHQKLPNKSAAEKMKAWWGKRFDALSELLR